MNTRQMQYILNDADSEAKIAADRNAAMKIIQGEVDDLHSVYKDISVLTSDQGQAIDKIDDDVKKADANTKQGVQQLEEAKIKVEQRRKNTIAIVIAVALALVLVVGGGFLLRGVLGMSGPVGMVVGAAIMLGGLAVVGGIGYGIYRLINFCRPKPAKQADVVDEPKPENNKQNRLSPAQTHLNVVKQAFSDDNIFSLDKKSPSLTDLGIDAVKSQVASQVFKRMV